MHFTIISAVPDLFAGFFNHSILKRAQESDLLTIDVVDIRKHGLGNYNQIDDKPYGGEAGMVLMAEPLAKCIEEAFKQRPYDEVIYLTPDGEVFNQGMANTYSNAESILLICGHYKGIDQRIRDKYVTREISIGDYVVTGGELGAAILVDSITRLIPGVINDERSALSDSFQDGLLAPPVYTRPADFEGEKVPDVLLSGNFAAIDAWKEHQALLRTKSRRPDLL
jgi:tRNA (guanine37-N1)-methyltransferase